MPLLLIGLVAPSPVEAQTAPPDGSSANTPPVVVSRLEFRQRTLPNGLTVYSVENHQTPTVAIQVWYRVGSKDDPTGRSGFAHLFEHMMFKSTKNMKSEMLDRLTEDVGGENNAYTTADVTVYHETVPSHYLETLLWAEADRLANLNVIQANFGSERAVVQEEYRQSVLAPPYGRLGVLINSRSFTAHPYKKDTIGSIPDLDAATLGDVQAFHRTFYRPDNAVLVVVGDFETAKLDAWVDKYFGRIGKPNGDVPRVTVKEPERTEEKRYKETAPNVPLPAVVMTFLTPPVAHADAEALRIAEVILSRGESSRLHQSLVYEQQIASDASASADLRDDVGLFVLDATAAGKKSIDEVEKRLWAEVEKAKTEGVTVAELEKARNLLLADALRERETNDGIASALGFAAVNLGDAERVNTDLTRLLAVTTADVQRVLRSYLTEKNRVVIRYEQGKGEPLLQSKRGGSDAGAGTEPGSPDTSPAPPSLALQERSTPPPPAAPRAAILPTPVERKLPNGLRVIVVPRPGSGLVSAELVVRTGAADDPAEKGGLAEFTAALLTRGTKTRSATKIAEEIEALGGAIESSSGWDGSFVTLSTLRARQEPAFVVFADVVLNPAFFADEVSRLRAETLDDLEVRLESPGTLARYTAARVAFGEGAYGHPPDGTPETVKRLTRDDVLRFHAAHFYPGNAVLVLGGDLTSEEGFALAEKALGSWTRKTTSAINTPKPVKPTPVKTGRVVVVDMPDAGQAAVYLIRHGIRRADPEYYRAIVADSVLGRGFSSRINQEVRIKRGLSYGAGSALDARRDIGPFVLSAQTKHETAAEVAVLLKSELARLASGPLPATELTPRKASLTGDYARSLETGGGLVAEVAELALYNLPLASLSTYLPSVQEVTAAQVKAIATKRLNARDASIVIVGDGRKFLTPLRARFKNVEVIPVDKLDLNRAALRR